MSGEAQHLADDRSGYALQARCLLRKAMALQFRKDNAVDLRHVDVSGEQMRKKAGGKSDFAMKAHCVCLWELEKDVQDGWRLVD